MTRRSAIIAALMSGAGFWRGDFNQQLVIVLVDLPTKSCASKNCIEDNRATGFVQSIVIRYNGKKIILSAKEIFEALDNGPGRNRFDRKGEPI